MHFAINRNKTKTEIKLFKTQHTTHKHTEIYKLDVQLDGIVSDEIYDETKSNDAVN